MLGNAELAGHARHRSILTMLVQAVVDYVEDTE